MNMHALLCGAILASACHTTQLPPVAVSGATTDDRAVMAALLEGTLREQRDRSIRAGLRAGSDPGIATGALFLVLDSTVPLCSFDRWSGNQVLGCFDISSSSWRTLLEASTCDFGPRQAGAISQAVTHIPWQFAERSAKRSCILRHDQQSSPPFGTAASVSPRE